MRVAFFGQSGPYAPPALLHLLQAQTSFRVVLVVEGRRRPIGRLAQRLLAPSRAKLAEGYEGLAAAARSGSLSELALAANTPVLQTCDVNSRASLKVLARHAPDWIVCVGFDRLFSRELLACAKVGGINAHPSALPELRGPSPLFWLLREGRRASAVTLHALDEKEDHGPIYAQESFVLPRRATGEEIYAVAGALAGRMLHAVLEHAAQGTLTARPQDHAQATRAPRPKPEDALVDPAQWRCEHLVDFACGAPYFRTPWMRLGDEVFFIRRGLRAEPGRSMPACYALQGATLVVQCRDGLAHLEIQV